MNNYEETAFHLETVFHAFNIQGRIVDVEQLGSGHINDTYRLINENENDSDYVLQRINQHVFKNPEGLMDNIERVTMHMKSKLAVTAPDRADKETLSVIYTRNGKNVHLDAEGNYWRMYGFMANTKCYNRPPSVEEAAEVGRILARFQTLLSDMDPNQLVDPIPRFFDISMRLDAFDAAIAADAAGRLTGLAQEIAFINTRRAEHLTILGLAQSGVLPMRIIHGDTKFNNVLLDEQDRGQCLVDLDLVMPGLVAYDFGDAVRTIINTADEDEGDLEKIQLNRPLFNSFAKGYIEAAVFLTQEEKASLLPGVLLFPYMQAVRFLTDFIAGDIYYKVAFPTHNLQRARNQMELLRKMEEGDLRVDTE